MEGKNHGAKKMAYNEYLDSRDKSRFTSLAQKLSQHINNLSEDSNCRIRWIWELIQNAKDVPNEFGKCKIRIEIQKDKLTFAHNGDPFRVSDLESLIAQYSSKPEENETETDTTGKYGTGFITTYILSRKVSIKGMFCMKTEQEMKLAEENEKKKQKRRIKQENEDQFEDLEEELLDENGKHKTRKFQGGSLYQKFQISLDREFKNRDADFYQKLMMTQRNFLDDLMKNDPKPKWERKINEYNTQFTYEELDEAAFKMVKDSMDCLKEIFPYALLFNPKLSDIHVLDRRQGMRIKNFQIKRQEESTHKGMKIFNVKILEQGKDPRILSFVYDNDEDSLSTIAMPVSLNDGKLKLLQVNHQFPKIFKQFPLIGCQDHGFNFVFTSKQFYPNQSRSDLLLKQIEGRSSSKKPSINWWAINNIFTKGLAMYKQLALVISEGHQNLLVMSLNNQFTHQDHKENRIDQLLQTFRSQMSNINFIEFSSGKRGCLKELVFPSGSSEKKNCEDHEYSGLLNSCFAILLGENVTLSDVWYQRMYPYLMSYTHIWKKVIKSKSTSECICTFKLTNFKRLVAYFGHKEKALDYIEKIYKFLQKYNPSFMTQGKSEQQIKFVLTNKYEFKDLNEMINQKKLMIKEEISPEYEQIALQIGINISEYTIYDRFAHCFETTKHFKLKDLFAEFKQVFFVYSKKSVKEIVQLGRFLTTFEISSQCIDLVRNCKHFDKVDTPLKVSDHDFKAVMPFKDKKQYRLFFELEVMLYFNEVINKCKRLSNFLPEIGVLPEVKNEGIQWLNQLYRLEEKLLKEGAGQDKKQYLNVRKFCPVKTLTGQKFFKTIENPDKQLIEKALSVSEQFVEIEKLKYFCYIRDQYQFKGHEPDGTDIEFYQIMRAVYNSINGYDRIRMELNDQILNKKIIHNGITGTSFKDKFEFILKIYNSNSDSYRKEKIAILNYVYYLRQIVSKAPELAFKIDVFADIEKKAFYDYPSLTSCIDKRENQTYAFHLVKNPTEIEAAMTLTEMYGSLEEVLKQLKKITRQ